MMDKLADFLANASAVVLAVSWFATCLIILPVLLLAAIIGIVGGILEIARAYS